MNSPFDRNRYRINSVSEQTGVPEATLRAWERRYQVPKPLRTPSGYRLYSPHDVQQVQQIRALCEGGMSPADAAKEVAIRSSEAHQALARVEAPTNQESSTPLRFLEELTFEPRNPSGVASLGDLVRVMDKAAVITASRQVGRHTVVVSMSELSMEVVLRHGQLLELSTQLMSPGALPIVVEVTCHLEQLVPPERKRVAFASFVLMALDGG